jgi:DNA-binding cell septation regulator SpoVG
MTSKGLVGYISFIYNNELKINDVGIYTRPNKDGFRFLYPIKPLSNGKILSVVFPINKEIGNQLESLLSKEYGNFLSKFGAKSC